MVHIDMRVEIIVVATTRCIGVGLRTADGRIMERSSSDSYEQLVVSVSSMSDTPLVCVTPLKSTGDMAERLEPGISVKVFYL